MEDFTTLTSPHASTTKWDTSYMYTNPAYAASGAGRAAVAPNYNLASGINNFMTQQAQNPYLANMPGYSPAVAQRGQVINQQLKGQLPEDVIYQINQAAAQRGVGNGMVGGQNFNAAYLRALGLNSLQMQQQGSQNLTQGIADTPVPQLFNPASLVVPQTLAAQELGAARAGMASGGGGGGYAGASGMPNLSAPSGRMNPSTVDIQQGMFNSPTFNNGMYVTPAYSPATTTETNDWWSQYGQKQPNPFAQNNIDFGQFNQEDWWTANNSSTLDASNPYTYFE